MKPLWTQIADEWLNRGFHYEVLDDGRIHIWYDGVMRSYQFEEPSLFPQGTYAIVQSDGLDKIYIQ